MATQAGNSSGRVVAIGSIPPPGKRKAIVAKRVGSDASLTSACAIAVWHSGHQSVGATCVYVKPCRCNWIKDHCETRRASCEMEE